MTITQSVVKKINKYYHQHSDRIHSIDFCKVPEKLRIDCGVDEEAFKFFVQLPYSRTNDGLILINEALPDWEIVRDLLLALDRLPDSLLIDIYRMDKHRWDGSEIESNEELVRNILYHLIPDITWAHSFKQN